MPSNDQPIIAPDPREKFAATVIEALREQAPEVVIEFDLNTGDVLRAADALAAGLVTLAQVAATVRRALFGEG